MTNQCYYRPAPTGRAVTRVTAYGEVKTWTHTLAFAATKQGHHGGKGNTVKYIIRFCG